MTKTWSVTPSDEQLSEIAAVLERGGVVLLPTDTIYGLHGRASDDVAMAKIAAMKGRDADKPFVVIGASVAQLEDAGAQLGPRARNVVEELWPGPLTAIVTLARPLAASRGAQSIAMRVPAVDWLRELLKKTGPLASTSANRSGEPPIADPKTLSRDLQTALDGILDAGPRTGEPSTIVDFTGDEPRFIREGESVFAQKVWKTLRKSL